MTVDRGQLIEEIKEWATAYIGFDFLFREYQLDTIADIITNILEDVNHTQIIEAPTGSGKSLLNIISAGVLSTYYNKTSYILCSDLYLWKQYEDFINKHIKIKREFGILKGQTGNYNCRLNNEDIRNADCRVAGIQWASLFNTQSAGELGYECAAFCPYVKARKKALRSKVVIMTYQLYHYMINIVNKLNSNVFKRKDIIFCDECHNIPSIVQNNFKPEIKLSDFNQFKQIYQYRKKPDLDLFQKLYDADDNIVVEQNNGDTPLLINDIISYEELESNYKDIFNTLSKENLPDPEVYDYIDNYIKLLNSFIPTVEFIESELSYKKQVLHKNFNKDDVKFYKCCSWFRNTLCLWNDFYICIKDAGIEYVVKTVNENRLLKETVIDFAIAKEDFITWKFLLNTAEHRVMMSATIGGYNAFSENIGIRYIEENFIDGEEIQYTVIPSTFNFDKSPIYFLNRYKMSYKEKEESIKQLKPIIYKICSGQFNGKRGMIQTGSYANAKEIYDNAPADIKKRMLLYNNSKEKTKAITVHQMSSDTILIGPTLVEGIDLPGDQCRFIIILKVPYPVITDKYVKKKMDLFPLWYNSTTSNIIIQGIGRGNRFNDDYCTTYILDACFLTLYNATKTQYPVELQNRIKIYT